MRVIAQGARSNGQFAKMTELRSSRRIVHDDGVPSIVLPKRPRELQMRRGGSGRKKQSIASSQSGHHQTNGIPRKVIRSVAEYVKEIAELKSKNSQDLILFRGQRDCDKPLVPKIGRGETRLKGRNQAQLGKVEKHLLDLFKQLSVPFLHSKPEKDLEWLAIAQHHGLSTRLLDWTANALAALWFAVRKEPAKDKNQIEKLGAVWILNPVDGDFLRSEAEKHPFDLAKTRVYRPRHISERLIAQAGYFTVHCLDRAIPRFTPLDRDLSMRKRLMEIQIDPQAFSDIRDNLERHGVSDLNMFPDLEGVCRYITWNNSLLRDEIDPPNIILNQDK